MEVTESSCEIESLVSLENEKNVNIGKIDLEVESELLPSDFFKNEDPDDQDEEHTGIIIISSLSPLSPFFNSFTRKRGNKCREVVSMGSISYLAQIYQMVFESQS